MSATHLISKQISKASPPAAKTQVQVHAQILSIKLCFFQYSYLVFGFIQLAFHFLWLAFHFSSACISFSWVCISSSWRRMLTCALPLRLEHHWPPWPAWLWSVVLLFCCLNFLLSHWRQCSTPMLEYILAFQFLDLAFCCCLWWFTITTLFTTFWKFGVDLTGTFSWLVPILKAKRRASILHLFNCITRAVTLH